MPSNHHYLCHFSIFIGVLAFAFGTFGAAVWPGRSCRRLLEGKGGSHQPRLVTVALLNRTIAEPPCDYSGQDESAFAYYSNSTLIHSTTIPLSYPIYFWYWTYYYCCSSALTGSAVEIGIVASWHHHRRFLQSLSESPGCSNYSDHKCRMIRSWCRYRRYFQENIGPSRHHFLSTLCQFHYQFRPSWTTDCWTPSPNWCWYRGYSIPGDEGLSSHHFSNHYLVSFSAPFDEAEICFIVDYRLKSSNDPSFCYFFDSN